MSHQDIDRRIEVKLRGHGLRVTKSRVQIYGVLESCGVPMSHGELESKLFDVDRVTLYRVLDALCDSGMVHKIQGQDGLMRYCAHGEVDGCPGGHPHFLCLECGEMLCLEGQVMGRVGVPDGYEVIAKQYVLEGLCARCKGFLSFHKES